MPFSNPSKLARTVLDWPPEETGTLVWAGQRMLVQVWARLQNFVLVKAGLRMFVHRPKPQLSGLGSAMRTENNFSEQPTSATENVEYTSDFSALYQSAMKPIVHEKVYRL